MDVRGEPSNNCATAAVCYMTVLSGTTIVFVQRVDNDAWRLRMNQILSNETLINYQSVDLDYYVFIATT